MKLALVVLAMMAPLAAAQPRRPPEPDAPLDAATRAQVIDGSIAALKKSYVFPDVAAKLETLLRDRARTGAYDKLASSAAFADQLTKDLQSVSHDLHMRMRYSAKPVPPDEDPDAPPSPEARARQAKWLRDLNGGFVKVERLDGNVGYLRLDYVLPGDEVGKKLAAAMTLVADTDALILDLRHNHGGEPSTVALVVSYLYSEYDELHINDIYTRPSNSTREYWTVASLPGPRFAGKPVYVLTSKETFSGGEELSYDLKNLKRATLVGEVTGGGANPGGPMKVAEHFALFVPVGRAISPVTRTNWEGVGVQPDVAVPAARAFDVAYGDALKAQRKRVSASESPGLAREIEDALARLSGTPAPRLPPVKK
jgi:hypothetical protein